ILAENDLTLTVTDLADGTGAVVRVPVLFEAEHVDVEACGAGDVGDEEDRAGIPAVGGLACRGIRGHGSSRYRCRGAFSNAWADDQAWGGCGPLHRTPFTAS